MRIKDFLDTIDDMEHRYIEEQEALEEIRAIEGNDDYIDNPLIQTIDSYRRIDA